MGILHYFGRIVGVLHQQHDHAGNRIDRHAEVVGHAGEKISCRTVGVLCLLEHHLFKIGLCEIGFAQQNNSDPVRPSIGEMDHISQILTAGTVFPVDKDFFQPIVFLYVIK